MSITTNWDNIARCGYQRQAKQGLRRNKKRLYNTELEPGENPRQSLKYHYWRKACLARDNYKCVNCGGKGILHVHHIEHYDKEKNKRFNVENGVTLCVKCHEDKHPWLKHTKQAPISKESVISKCGG